MNITRFNTLSKITALFFLAVSFCMGCSSQSRIPEGVLDTPEHHVSSGLKLLRKHYLNDAKREFELALQLNPACADAHRGLGLTYGEERQFGPAFESMRRAMETAGTDRETALAQVGFMRLYTLEEGDLWLDKAKARFLDATQLQKEMPEAYFYLGLAYKKANQLSEAEGAFKRVLEINNGLVLESQRELRSLFPFQ